MPFGTPPYGGGLYGAGYFEFYPVPLPADALFSVTPAVNVTAEVASAAATVANGVQPAAVVKTSVTSSA